MKKIIILLVIGTSVLSSIIAPRVFSQENVENMDLDQITHKLEELHRALEASQKATEPLESQVENLQTQLTGIENRVAAIERDIAEKKVQIEKGYQELDENKDVFNQTIRDYYIKSHLISPLLVFFAASDASEITRFIIYQKKNADRDKESITALALKVLDLEGRKEKLEQEEKQLAGIKTTLAADRDELNKIVTDAKNYQTDLSGQIAALSARQQSLLSERAGNFSVSVGNAALSDDYNASLTGWQEKAPSDSFTIFSFGAYAGNGSNYRRNGMSQYGALGRVKENPNISYEEILQAYYPGSQLVDYSVMGTINVDNHGSLPFEDNYLKGIHEVPESWPMAVLKAQVIAARTYAVRVTNNGASSICPTDSCQVYQPNLKTGNWATAVNDTKGKILVDSNGNPISTQYVSTPGGYLDTKGWDTNCGDQGCLAGGAYDRESPWFYKAWYTHYKYGQGFAACQRNNPWLSQQDIADILNAWIVYKNGSGDEGRILPPDGCGGGDPYSINDMKQMAGGNAISSVSSVSISQSSGGYTSNVTFQTNKGPVSITGFDTNCAHANENCKDFWTIFNLRAPGNISIKNRMFDIRSK